MIMMIDVNIIKKILCTRVRKNMFSQLRSSFATAFNNRISHPFLARTSMIPAQSSQNAGSAVVSCNACRGFKVKNSIKRMCEHCYITRKKNKKWYVYCKANPRHKQRQL